MHFEVVRHGLVDLDEESLELLGPVTPASGGDHLAGRDIEGCEEICDPVTHIVMRPSLHLAGSHRQDRLCPIEHLDAGLLVDAAHGGVLGRVHVDDHHAADLLDEKRVLGELEGVGCPGFEPEGPPDATDGGLAHPCRLGHVRTRPVGGVLRFVGESLDHERLDVVITEL
jgi:hypothetical protein